MLWAVYLIASSSRTMENLKAEEKGLEEYSINLTSLGNIHN